MDGMRAMLEHVEQEHGPPEHLAPFFVYLCSEHGANVSASVFDVTAGGRISRYAETATSGQISKTGTPWTLDELASAVPAQLLTDYRTPDRRLSPP
jgi:hypothetical protein